MTNYDLLRKWLNILPLYSQDCWFLFVVQESFKRGKNNPVDVISRQPKTLLLLNIQ